MKTFSYLLAGPSLMAVSVFGVPAVGASAHPVLRPHSFGVMSPYVPLIHVGPYEAPYVANKNTRSGSWKDVRGVPPFQLLGPSDPQLLTDGSVVILDAGTRQWYKLTPDGKGKFTDGTWSTIAPMPTGDCPVFFATQILPDGRMIENGGEDSKCGPGFSAVGALYDPVADSWTSVSPPDGWTTIGDAESIILPNGTYMLANCCDTPSYQAVASISGTNVSWTQQESYGDNDEQAYTALPDGNVLMVDVWNYGNNHNDYEIYQPSLGTWSLAGTTADNLSTTGGPSPEIGPSPLTPEGPRGGTVIQFSANPLVGVNDIYSVANNAWTSGPVMQYEGTIYDCGDAPAATLPDGNILVQASPGTYETPSHFWEFKISKQGTATATQVNDPNQAPNTASFEGNLLVLPTGQALWVNGQAVQEVAVYTPKGSPNAAWLPVVSSVANTLTVGSKSNSFSGGNFNGWDLGGVYGDDWQAATNFPLVRISNNATGDVCFARSYNFSTMGVWTTGTTNAEFDIPSTCELGASTLQVIVNGIASIGAPVTLNG